MEQEFLGIDLHRRRSVIVRMSPDGEGLSTEKIDNSPMALAVGRPPRRRIESLADLGGCMTDRVVGWAVLGQENKQVLVCSRCLRADTSYDANLFGAGEWAVNEGLAPYPPAASEVLAEHPEAERPCVRCAQILTSKG